MKKTKKVLLLAYSFPPLNTIGALRPYKMAAVFKRHHWEVIVVAAKRLDSNNAGQKDLTDIRVVRYLPNVLSRFLARSGFGPRVVSTISGILIKLLRRLFLPDHTWLLCHRAQTAVDDILAKESIDAIVTSSFPFALHEVGFRVKERMPSLLWCADNRDMWAGNPYRGFSFLPLSMQQRVERRLLKHADLVCFASASTEAIYRERYGLEHAMTVLNGFEEHSVKSRNVDTFSDEPVNLVHTGSLYSGSRVVGPAVRAAELFCARGEKRVVFHLYGDACRADERPEDSSGVAIVEYGYVPRERAYSAQSHADFLVLAMAHVDFDKSYTPAKLFEYARTGKPIIALCDETSDVAAIVSTYGLGLATFDVEKIAAFIGKTLSSVRSGQWTYSRPVYELSAEYQFGKLVVVLDRGTD